MSLKTNLIEPAPNGNKVQIPALDTLNSNMTVTSRTAMAALENPESGQPVYLSEGGRSGTFVWNIADLSTEVAADTQQGIYIAPNNDATGASGAWVRVFNKADGINISWFGATSDGSTDSSTILAAALLFADTYSISVVNWDGDYAFSETLSLPNKLRVTGDYSRVPSASEGASKMTWVGAALPMFELATTGTQIDNVSVLNNGSATDFLEIVSGGQRLFLDSVTFSLPDVSNKFSRSVIRSSGNRIGYSLFREINASSNAPVFFDIDGEGTSNSITRLALKDSIFNAVSGEAMTVFKITDETIEVLNIENSTFNCSSGTHLTCVDTTMSPLTASIHTLNVSGCEFSGQSASTSAREFLLENVLNFNFERNQIAKDGSQDYFGSLVNSNLTSHYGNLYLSAGSVAKWECDTDSRAVIQSNKTGPTGGKQPAFVTPEAGLERHIHDGTTTAWVIDLDPAQNHVVREVRATTADSLSTRVNLDVACPGQLLTVIHTNASAGAVAAPSFNSGFFRVAAPTPSAPSAGNSKAYTFFYNGVYFQEVSRSVDEVSYA